MYQWETTSLVFIRPWITIPTETPSKEDKFKLDHTTGWQLNFDWSEKPDGTFRLRLESEERGNRGERSGNQAEHCGRGKSWYNGTKDRKEVSGFKNRHQAINYREKGEVGRLEPDPRTQTRVKSTLFLGGGLGGRGQVHVLFHCPHSSPALASKQYHSQSYLLTTASSSVRYRT